MGVGAQGVSPQELLSGFAGLLTYDPSQKDGVVQKAALGPLLGSSVNWRTGTPEGVCIRFSRTRRFRLLRRSLFRHRPVDSLLSLWRLALEQAPGIP